MIQKISYLGNNLFQLDDSTTPLETEDIKRLAMDAGKMSECQAKTFLEKLESSGEGELETTANTGVVVNVYEVDYTPPKDPNLETQQLGATVREPRDFITQYLFPSTSTEDVIVGLRKDLEEHHKEGQPAGQGRMPKNKKTSKNVWREVLSWRGPVEEENEYSEEDDYGEEREFRAPFSEIAFGYVKTDARCKKEAIDLFHDGSFESETQDYDNFQIEYHQTWDTAARRRLI